MPTALCKACRFVHRWRNTRGSSKPSVCHCGGEVVPAIFTEGGYVPVADRRGKGSGRKKVTCALCGRKRMAPSGNVRTLADGFRFTDYQRLSCGEAVLANIKPDQPLCWTHVEKIRAN